MHGNGHVNRLRMFEPQEGDSNKVSLVSTLVAAAAYYGREESDDMRQVLVDCVRDCLEQILGRRATQDEIERVLRLEV